MTARWALIGKEGDEFSEFALGLLDRNSPYQVDRRDGNIYFRTSFDDKLNEKQIRISHQITKKNYKEEYNYRLLVHSSNLYKRVLQQQDFPKEELNRIYKNIEDTKDFHRFSWFSKSLLYPTDKQAVEIFRTILMPNFFNWYPEGKALILTIDDKLHQRLAALRILGAIDRVGGRKVRKAKENFVNFLALEDAQPGGIVVPSKYITIPVMLSLPKPIGFLAPRVVDSALFLFDKPLEDVRGYFPRSGIEFYRSAASLLLHEDKTVRNDTGELLLDLDMIDAFSLISQNFPQESWLAFIKQYIARLNDFFIYITDPSNFVNQKGEWVNITHYFVWLSFERLCDEAILLISEENQYLRKMCLFRILDQLSFLGEEDQREQAKAFGNFILPIGASDPIKKGLSRYKGEIAKYLIGELDAVRKKLKNMIVNSTVLNEMRDVKSEEIVLLNGKRISYDDYTRKIVRDLRNTAHGYSPGEYLVTNKGNLPDGISLLAVLALLAFIAEPKEFLRSTWSN